MLISPTRPRSIVAASGSLPTHVVGFLVSVVAHKQTTPYHIRRRLAGGEGLNQPACTAQLGEQAEDG